MFLIGLLLFPACAPEPASIALDGPRTVTASGEERIPLERATVLDADEKPLDPQPRVAWSVDPADIVALEHDRLALLKDGTVTVNARVGEVSSSYTVIVHLDNDERTTNDNQAWTPGSACVPTDYGNGVYLFHCDTPNVQTSEFAKALAAFVGTHPNTTIDSVTAMPNGSSRWNEVDGYLVVSHRPAAY